MSVIFDLYDTVVVVDPIRRERHQEALARRLGLPTTAFLAHWRATSLPSNLGRIGRTEDRFREVMARARVAHADPAELAAAEHAFLRAQAQPVPGMAELLGALRSRGVRLGLLSNCSTSVRSTLEATGMRDLFDVVALSYEIGLAKPDPRFFQRVADELSVESSASLYVADGVGGELEAAVGLGMGAVRAAWSNPAGTAPPSVPVARSVDALARLIG